MPLSYAVGLLSYGQRVVVAAFVGAFSAMFDVAYQSWVPDLVTKPDLVHANGLLGATGSAGQLAGPGLAGLLVASLGGAYTLALDAVSFGVAALTSARVHTSRPTRSRQPAEHGRMRRQIAEGLRWLWRAVPLRLIAVCSATVRHDRTGDRANRALTYSAMPLGALIGGALASTAGPRLTLVAAATGFALAAMWLAPLAWGRRLGSLATGGSGVVAS